MSQQAIELILTRRLSAHLSMATFLVDASGRVLHFNEAAQRILGDRLGEARALSARELATLFDTRDEQGEPVPAERLPIVVALEERHPAHARLRVLDGEGRERDVAVTAVPLIGQGSRFVGAVAFFWEIPR